MSSKAKTGSCCDKNLSVLTFCLCELSDLPKMAFRQCSCTLCTTFILSEISSPASATVYLFLSQTSQPNGSLCFSVCPFSNLSDCRLSYTIPCDPKYYIIYGSFKKFIRIFFFLLLLYERAYVCSSFTWPLFSCAHNHRMRSQSLLDIWRTHDSEMVLMTARCDKHASPFSVYACEIRMQTKLQFAKYCVDRRRR